MAQKMYMYTRYGRIIWKSSGKSGQITQDAETLGQALDQELKWFQVSGHGILIMIEIKKV